MLDWLKGAALIAFIGLCLTVMVDEHRTSKHVNNLLMALAETVESVHTQLPLIQQDIHSTSSALNDTATALSNTAIATTTAVQGLRSDLAPLLAKANADLLEGHHLILEAGLTAMEARKASAEERAALPALTSSAQASIDSLNQEMLALKAFTEHADALVNDPEIKDTIHHVNGTTADVQHAVNKYVYPGPWQKAWNVISGVGLDIGKFLIP